MNQAPYVIATPTRGSPKPAYSDSIHNFLGTKFKEGLNVPVIRVACASGVEHPRNLLVQKFLEMPDKTHMIFVDDDVEIPMHLDKLASHNLDIVAGVTPAVLRNPPGVIVWHVYKRIKEGLFPMNPFMGLQPVLHVVDAVASGCLCISRKVLEHPDMKAPFKARYDENGVRTLGEDMYFCERAKAAGFDIHADFSVICGHHQDNVPIWDIMKWVMSMMVSARQEIQGRDKKTKGGIIIPK